MLSPVHIQNFKSIRDLKFQANRVNLFIGEPNAGKSNIIEALACLSPGNYENGQEIFRFKTSADLFFDQKIANDISIEAGSWRVVLKFNSSGNFQGGCFEGQTQRSDISMGHGGFSSLGVPQSCPIRYYFFKPLSIFANQQPGVLNPPFGDNLVAVLYSNEGLRQRIGAVIRAKGFRLQLKPTEHELLIAKDVDDELYSYPWTSVSETLRRVAFFMAVIETNKDAVLLLDEPETNIFPFYTKYLAERIALDESNQFFITTHNPYMLSSIVQKTQPKDLSVFVVRMDKFETTLAKIPESRLPELLELDADAFFNLDRLVEP